MAGASYREKQRLYFHEGAVVDDCISKYNPVTPLLLSTDRHTFNPRPAIKISDTLTEQQEFHNVDLLIKLQILTLY